MAAEPAHAEGDDGRETDGLEEQGDVQHRHAGVLALGDGGGDEDDAGRQEGEEHPPWAYVPHDEDAEEAACREGALGAGEELRRQRVGGVASCVLDVVDEVARDGDLGTRVAELRKGSVEEPVLLPERLVIRVGVCLVRLVGHVGVGDLRDGREEEHESEDEDEDGDR